MKFLLIICPTCIILACARQRFPRQGDRIIVLGGSHIGEGSVIQTGSVVRGDVLAYDIARKSVKYGDIEHFKMLKEQNEFN